jgi:hypothetical protein
VIGNKLNADIANIMNIINSTMVTPFMRY